jgi:hypothetical protein
MRMHALRYGMNYETKQGYIKSLHESLACRLDEVTHSVRESEHQRPRPSPKTTRILLALFCISPSTTANSGILLHAIPATLSNTEALVSEDEVANIRSDEDANDNVPVVIHSQQHDKVRDCKLQHMQ